MTDDAPRTAIGAFLRAAFEHPAYWIVGAVVGLLVLALSMAALFHRGSPFAEQVAAVGGSIGLAVGLTVIWPIVTTAALLAAVVLLVGKKVDARRARRRTTEKTP